MFIIFDSSPMLIATVKGWVGVRDAAERCRHLRTADHVGRRPAGGVAIAGGGIANPGVEASGNCPRIHTVRAWSIAMRPLSTCTCHHDTLPDPE